MKCITLVGLDWLGEPGEGSILDPMPPTLEVVASRSAAFRLAPLRPECDLRPPLLGLAGFTHRLAEGPLRVAAFEAHTPPKSVPLCLDLLSLEDGGITTPPHVTPELGSKVIELAERLQTPKLRLIEGERAHHAALWLEGSLDLSLRTPDEAIERGLRPSLPEGDGEPMLRRFIDDSINLLGEQEFNMRRIDEGLAPVNLIWPWGQGFPPVIPNLALQRGTPCHVLSPALGLRGLSKMCGYTHGPTSGTNAGLSPPFGEWLKAHGSHPNTLIVDDSISSCRKAGRIEESRWIIREFDEAFLEPLLKMREDDPFRLTLLCPITLGSGEFGGLGLVYESHWSSRNVVPFSEEGMSEDRLPIQSLAESIERSLSCTPISATLFSHPS